MTPNGETNMSPNTNIIVGVFNQESKAQRALDALRQAGFAYDQIGVATPRQKNVDLISDLQALDLPGDQANYYGQELSSGRTVVSVRPDNREAETMEILRRYGAYDYANRTASSQSGVADAGLASSKNTDANTMRTGTSRANDMNTARTTDVNAAGLAASERDRLAQTQATGSIISGNENDYYQPRSLRLREERLNATKERVQSGEVQLHKEIVTEQKTIDVPVTHEEVIIERHAVTDGRVDNSTPIGSDETIRIPVSEEQVNVTKDTVVTGEVSIGKKAVQENKRVTDTVRREEARVEQEGNVTDPTIHDVNDRDLPPDPKRKRR